MKTYNTHRKNISWDRLIFVNIGIALSLLFLSCCFGPAYWPLGPAYKIGRNVVNGSENLKINYEKLSQIPLEEVALLGVPRPLRLVIREMPWGGGEWGKRYRKNDNYFYNGFNNWMAFTPGIHSLEISYFKRSGNTRKCIVEKAVIKIKIEVKAGRQYILKYSLKDKLLRIWVEDFTSEYTISSLLLAAWEGDSRAMKALCVTLLLKVGVTLVSFWFSCVSMLPKPGVTFRIRFLEALL